MTVQEQLDRLTQIAAAALESIQALERVTAKHDTQIANMLTALETMDADRRRTDAAIRALADEVINTQREWQAYLRRIPRQ
jgi:type II secretory pathway component PulJ